MEVFAAEEAQVREEDLSKFMLDGKHSNIFSCFLNNFSIIYLRHAICNNKI